MNKESSSIIAIDVRKNLIESPEAYLESCEISVMALFSENSSGILLLTILAKEIYHRCLSDFQMGQGVQK